MRTLAILNPKAGKGNSVRFWQRARREMDGARAWECVNTRGTGHARELARQASASGYARVVAIGGDGTFCEVADGLAHSETALAMVPFGTGNDTAHNLGIPRDPFEAARLAATGTPRRIDLGRVETAESTTCFLNIAGFGFDAEVAWRVAQIPRLIGGTAPYVLGVLQTLWTYQSAVVRVLVDGRQIERRMFMVAVANMASYGGGMRIAPDAAPDDGMFDVCLVDDVGRLEVLRLVPRMYAGGHVGHPAVTLLRGRNVTADADQRVRCHADGELVGELPARFSLLPGALHCVTGFGAQQHRTAAPAARR